MKPHLIDNRREGISTCIYISIDSRYKCLCTVQCNYALLCFGSFQNCRYLFWWHFLWLPASVTSPNTTTTDRNTTENVGSTATRILKTDSTKRTTERTSIIVETTSRAVPMVSPWNSKCKITDQQINLTTRTVLSFSSIFHLHVKIFI